MAVLVSKILYMALLSVVSRVLTKSSAGRMISVPLYARDYAKTGFRAVYSATDADFRRYDR